ncbi:hypothetical protein D187_005872 [Cystobacter fuscus DSM 2262]|uniref:Uncharacterized protein n=1 Tax=Cystobacter fuscus (strain ATCC 25194 / DSM 2262 / NBRC 100088 / M29) TaxID=1242864 RepID=S9PKB7_CYSF2|nr:hypothetical protein D187_005872 [Cystobacter fuscus DSM 2262]
MTVILLHGGLQRRLFLLSEERRAPGRHSAGGPKIGTPSRGPHQRFTELTMAPNSYQNIAFYTCCRKVDFRAVSSTRHCLNSV